MKHTIIFVFNANATLSAQASDFMKRLLTPDKYQCNLCMVTYSQLGGMKDEWGLFVDSLSEGKEFLHKDEFHEKYPSHKDIPLPAIFLTSDGKTLSVIASREEINDVKTVSEMETLVTKKLGQYMKT